MTLSDIKTALLTVTEKVHHYDATGETGNYIVWAEDNQAGALWANGKMQEQVGSGTIDYYTKAEYDTNFNAIQNALKNAGISFRWNSTQYETNGYIHYEWIFGVV